jgi:hypothetical protein
MIPYWIAFALPVIAMLMMADRPDRRHPLPLILYGIFAALMIGTRFQVGADWVSYLRFLHRIHFTPFMDAIATTDGAYAALNWIMVHADFGITGVNMVCGIIFAAGLIDFAWRTPNPWFAVSVAVPYLLIVVSMGYTRQGVALGFEFFALGALSNGRYRSFFVFVLCAAAFHRTAILLSLLGILSGPNRFSPLRALLGAVVAYLSLRAFLLDHYESLFRNYVEVRQDSSGGLIRTLMNALPAAILLSLRRAFRQHLKAGSPWFLFAFASLLCVPLVDIASTAVDRLALYLAPLQLYVWSHLPRITNAILLKPAIVLYHAIVLFVWLEYATHAKYWIPYESVLWLQ